MTREISSRALAVRYTCIVAVFTLIVCSWDIFPYEMYGDSTYEAVLEHAFTHNWQFGVDVIYTSGPLSLLSSSFSTGENLWLQAIWNVFRAIVMTMLLFRVVREFPLWQSVIFILGSLVVVMPNVPVIDRKDMFIIGVGGFLLLTKRLDTRLSVLMFVVYAATVSHSKFVNLVLMVALFGLFAASCVFDRKIKQGGVYVLGFIAAYLMVYLISGQGIGSLHMYLLSSFQIMGGYSEAMAIHSSSVSMTMLGFFLLTVGVAITCCQFWTDRSLRNGVLTLWYLAFFFILWKHGFCRDDSTHRISFFAGIFWMCWLLASGFRGGQLRYVGLLGICVSSLSFYGIFADEMGRYNDRVKSWIYGTPYRMQALWPTVARSDLLFRQNQVTEMNRVEGLQSIVGDRSVDIYQRDQGAAFMAGLNYTPRPVFQSFAVYTPWLEEKNREFYNNDERSPEMVLMYYNSIDGRLPATADSGMLLTLLRRYKLSHFCLTGKDGQMRPFLIFSKLVEAVTEEVAFELLEEGQLTQNDHLELSKYQGQALWLELKHLPALDYKLQKFLWKPSPIYIKMFSGDESARYRIVPGMVEAGFLLSPFLTNGSDMRAYSLDQVGRQLDSLTVLGGETIVGFAKDLRFKYRLYRVPDLADFQVSSSED